jgi:hypothetical protein
VKRGGQIDGENRVPLFRRELIDRCDVLDAGVVDENVDTSPTVERQPRHLSDVSRLRHVGCRIERRHSEVGGYLLPGALDVLTPAEPVENDG